MKGSETIKINHLMFVHRRVNMFSCNVCQKTFTRGYNMRRHMEEQHRYGPEQECSSTPQPRAPAPTNAPPCIPLPFREKYNGPVTYHLNHRIELTDRYRIKQILSGGEKASTAENLEIFPLVNEHVPNMYRMCNG